MPSGVSFRVLAEAAKGLVERPVEEPDERPVGRSGLLWCSGEVRVKDISHAQQQAGVRRVRGDQARLAGEERRVHEDHAGRDTAADKAADDLPHDDELIPGERDLLFGLQAAPGQSPCQVALPSPRSEPAELPASLVRYSGRPYVLSKTAVPDVAHHPVVERVDGERHVVGPRMRAGEEVYGADRGLAAGQDDVVPPLDREQRSHQYLARERGDVTTAQPGR